MIPDSASGQLQRLLDAVQAIREQEDDRWSVWDQFGTPDSVRVTTTAEVKGARLPDSGLPIRGLHGVETKVNSYRRRNESTSHEALVWSAYTGSFGQSDSLKSERQHLGELVDELFDLLDSVRGLADRVFESMGFKTYEADEVRLKARQPGEHNVRLFERIRVLDWGLAQALDELNFDLQNWPSFGRWRDTVQLTLENLSAFAARETNDYDVVAFLNCPPVDSVEEVSLGMVKVVDMDCELFIGHAHDELLNRLFEAAAVSYRSSEKIETVNSTLRFRVKIPCDARVQDYLNVYRIGAEIMGKAADVLRVLRDEDIGIQALEVFEGTWGTPSIRKTYAEVYQPEFDSFNPRRSYFIVETSEPLSVDEIDALRNVLPNYVNGNIILEGLEVAMRRFRDSQERYSPYDHQSLLDIAIAFEAVFLNDTDNTQELSYRLALRVARFLGQNQEARINLFNLIRDLYAVRSRIAHGTEHTDLKPRDAKKLENVFNLAPVVLRWALRKFLEGAGPLGLKDGDITTWWRKLELE